MAFFETAALERSTDGWEPVTWEFAISEYGPAWTNQPAVRKVVGFIARQLASTPLHVYEISSNNDRDRVRDGLLHQVLKRPSRAPGITPYRFWESWLIDGLLNDRAIAELVWHDDGGLELVRIPARSVTFKHDSLGRITKLKITTEKGRIVERDPKDFLIDVGYSERGSGGTSPLKTLQHILAEHRESVDYRRSIWRNSARVPMVIERPKEAGKFEEGAFNRFKRSWQQFVKGGSQEGGTPILEDGMTLKEVTAFRPRDTLDLEGRKLADIEVASAYYIAPELVGAREGTFANIKAFKEMLYGPNLGPYYDAWQQALNQTLVPLLEPKRDVYIEAHIAAKMRGSFEEQISYLSTAVGAPVMTRNEARPMLNLNQLDGGDEIVTPLNVLLGGQASPQDGRTAGRGGGSLEPVSEEAKSGLDADELSKLVTSVGTLIRAGFEPQAALAAMGLDPIEHSGLLSVTAREDVPKDAVSAFKERQSQVVSSQKAAGVLDWWDRARWDRELTDDLSKSGVDPMQAASLARLINDATERELLGKDGSNADEND